jgi:hypothetical protein
MNIERHTLVKKQKTKWQRQNKSNELTPKSKDEQHEPD